MRDKKDQYHFEVQTLANCIGGWETLLDLKQTITKHGIDILSDNNVIKNKNISISWEPTLSSNEASFLGELLLALDEDEATQQQIIDDNSDAFRRLCSLMFDITPSDVNHKGLRFYLFLSASHEYYAFQSAFLILFYHPYWLVKWGIDYEKPSRSILDLIRDRDAKALLNLLKNNSNIINAPGSPDPLMLAVKQGDLKIIKILIDYGADLNRCAHMGNTPLLFAISYEQFDIARLLLDNGADPEIGDYSLHLAKYSHGGFLKKNDYDALIDNLKSGKKL